MVKLEISSVFQELSKKLIKEYWDFYPTNGSRIGQHEYEGNLPTYPRIRPPVGNGSCNAVSQNCIQ
ncbi:MAG: hypothetical protein CM1200mP22_10900 [Dehalococcoidia bacterium]|nr:MAG: hypothetical protein CM1200mP22_10900 [Dehalococcoidia bacterium]